MRLQRSPTSSLSSASVMTGVAASSPSPSSGSSTTTTTNTTATLSRDSSYASMRGSVTPVSKRPHTRAESTSVLSAHGAHYHVRHHTNLSVASVDLVQPTTTIAQDYAQSNGKDAAVAYKQPVESTVVDGAPAGAARAQAATRPSSYATQAYREFLASNGNSANTSAASSLAPSRQVSRGNSGYNSQATSGQSSRAASPVSKRDEEGHEQSRTLASHGHNHAHASNDSSHYVDALVYPLSHTTTTTTTTTTTQVSTLSFGNLVLAKSDSQDSLDDGRTQMLLPKYRPNHFTFSSDDIMKSFLRAAERDRARAEREVERQREAQQRLQLEQEYERRRVAQRDMAYAVQVQAAHAYRADSVGASLSSSDEEEDAAPTRRRRRFPPIPAHFKFSTHDVAKSAAKPSQRQNIGHWTTFPRSGTVVIAASQLRAWIQTLHEAHQADERAAAAAKQRVMSAERKQLSAPNSPASNGTATHKADAGTSTSRVAPRGSVSQLRRASVPHAVLVGGASTQGTTPARTRPTHTRSATLASYEKDALVEKLSSSATAGGCAEKTSTRGGHATTTAHESAAEKSILLRRSGLGGGGGHGHGHGRQGSSVAELPRFEQQNLATHGLLGRRASLPVKGLPGASQVASVAAGALDASARRAAVLQARQQSLTTGPILVAAGGADGVGLNGSTASAPGSTSHSPTRPTSQNGRLVKSTHVSPSRHQRLAGHATTTTGAHKSSLPPAQAIAYTPMPPGQRKASLGSGGESKSASASNSPQLVSRTHALLGSVGLNESGWAHAAGQYEKTLLDVYQQVAHGHAQLQPPPPQPHHAKATASLASLYRDVPSSGYGQTTRGAATRLV